MSYRYPSAANDLSGAPNSGQPAAAPVFNSGQYSQPVSAPTYAAAGYNPSNPSSIPTPAYSAPQASDYSNFQQQSGFPTSSYAPAQFQQQTLSAYPTQQQTSFPAQQQTLSAYPTQQQQGGYPPQQFQQSYDPQYRSQSEAYDSNPPTNLQPQFPTESDFSALPSQYSSYKAASSLDAEMAGLSLDAQQQQNTAPPLPPQPHWSQAPSSMPMPPLPLAKQPQLAASHPNQPSSLRPAGAGGGPAMASMPSVSALQMVPLKDRQSLYPSHVIPTDPRYLSFTVNAVPSSTVLREKSSLAYAFVLRPLADPASPDHELPLINFGTVGVIRCTSCRAYVNPFVTWLDNCTRWRCNYCGRGNDTPQGYQSPLDPHTGQRSDATKRPELTNCSIEIVAPVEYMVRQPMPPVYVFVIDVSVNSVRSGMLQSLCDAVLAVLDKLPGGSRTLIGFITFDSTVHFYGLRSSSQAPQMYVMSDLEDVFLPTPADLLVELDDTRAQVKQLLESLPSMHAKTTDVESALGSALDAALKLCGRIGGKMLVFLSGLPSLEPGRLSSRENLRLLGTEKENTLLNPANDFYKKKSALFQKYQIAVDLFFFSPTGGYSDISTIEPLAKFTAGQVYYYPGFHSQSTQAEKFKQELKRDLTRATGWEAVIRVRASKGVLVDRYMGNFHLRSPDLLGLPATDCDKAFVVEMNNEEAMLNSTFICVQTALLYTTSFGERRIRVHNAILPVTGQLMDLFMSTNAVAMANVLAKQAIPMAMTENLSKAREFLRTRCINICRQQRLANQHRPLEFDPLAALPLLTLGLVKGMAFKDGTEVKADLRSCVLHELTSMGIIEFETFARPRLLNLQDLLTGPAGLIEEKNGNTVILPSELNLSVESLRTDGAYLADNGFDVYLRLGRMTSPVMLKSLFGIASLDGIGDVRLLKLYPPAAEDRDSVSRRFQNILEFLRKINVRYQDLTIVREGTPGEAVLVEFT